MGRKLKIKSKSDCSMCGCRIMVMCFLGTGVCSDLCRKARDGGKTRDRHSSVSYASMNGESG